MNTDFIKGVIVPILTPINENEFIDEAKLRDQVNYVIDGGVLGIEPLLDAVTYTRRLPLEHLDESLLDRQVGRHVDTVEALRASIARLQEQAPTPQAAAETGWNDGMLRI